MRFEVPQFIEVEDKIIGPFTWKQFVYLAGGAGAMVVVFLALGPFFFVLFGLPIGGLAGFLAFQQVNNRPFADFLESVVTYFTGSKLYLWRKEHEQIVHTAAEEAPVSVPPKKMPNPTTNNINSLSKKLELEALQGNHQ